MILLAHDSALFDCEPVSCFDWSALGGVYNCACDVCVVVEIFGVFSILWWEWESPLPM